MLCVAKNNNEYVEVTPVTVVKDNSLLNVIKGLTSIYTTNHPFELTADMFDENSTEIGQYRYQYNRNIIKVETPTNITSIGDYAFQGCSLLKNVILSNVKTIGQSAFNNMSLNSITLSSALTLIGSYAFYTCLRVNFLGTLDQWATITFSDEKSSPIAGAKDLYINDELVTEVDLPIATQINAYAFRTCKSITRVNAPLATNIGNYAFKENYGLINVKLSSVTKMGYGSFYSCTKLAIVDFRNVTQVPTIQSNTGTFQNVPTSCKFIIPDSLYDSWIASTNWVSLYNKGYQFIKASEYTEA